MIRIGVLGMSPGNAHPYSWSAIVNGHFDGDEICRIGYPAVAAYLEANRDTIGIPGARVTHVWAQSPEIARSIAAATGISNIAQNPAEMVGEVDAVMLLRDDPESHREMSVPCIGAGIPLFVDKPLAFSGVDLDWFAGCVRKGSFVMSCSSMRYAAECRVIRQDIEALGKISLVTAVGKKDWKKYGIHLLEAVFSLLGDPVAGSVRHAGETDREVVVIELPGGPAVTLHLFSEITGTFQVSVFGEKGWKLAEIKNSYSMFRDNIVEFVRSVEEGRPRLDFRKTENLIRILVAAERSRLSGGEKIKMDSF